ncbi:MAG: spore protease YyaC [Christensenellaceae bacterium]|jgi:putative sporulation protein YyaC|nr:spore protease YyaC [Christensenellaceae bacterium]
MSFKYSLIPVIMCIGSTSLIGDSLGPLVGDILREHYNINAYVYGSLKRPINGNNYFSYLNFINRIHPNTLIIAVDACVGLDSDIGKIKFSRNGVRAGAAIKKSLGNVGDIGILGIVAKKGENNAQALATAPIDLIRKTAISVADCVFKLTKAWDILLKSVL